jgi:DNA-binding response OmpR family regulator
MMAKAAPLKVLVVDDEPAIRRFLRTSLTAQGYLVTEAENGTVALEDLRRSPIDVLVLDLGLPDLNGLDIIERVRGQGSTVPTIVLSSRTDETGKVKALDLGADDYVTKPFGIDELRKRSSMHCRPGRRLARRGSAKGSPCRMPASPACTNSSGCLLGGSGRSTSPPSTSGRSIWCSCC